MRHFLPVVRVDTVEMGEGPRTRSSVCSFADPGVLDNHVRDNILVVPVKSTAAPRAGLLVGDERIEARTPPR